MDSSKFRIAYSKLKVRTALVNFLALAGASMLVYGGFSGLFGERAVPTVSAQSDQFLSRRVDQIENRFYALESRLNRLETQSRPMIAAPRVTDNRNTEIEFLRTQVDSLRTRLGEVECGILRLDERTLTPAARTARNRAATSPDPCRRDPAAAIRLSVRP